MCIITLSTLSIPQVKIMIHGMLDCYKLWTNANMSSLHDHILVSTPGKLCWMKPQAPRNEVESETKQKRHPSILLPVFIHITSFFPLQVWLWFSSVYQMSSGLPALSAPARQTVSRFGRPPGWGPSACGWWRPAVPAPPEAGWGPAGDTAKRPGLHSNKDTFYGINLYILFFHSRPLMLLGDKPKTLGHIHSAVGWCYGCFLVQTSLSRQMFWHPRFSNVSKWLPTVCTSEALLPCRGRWCAAAL